ncbi:MAG: FAD:protein FMN transferase [Myxococcales bacterium]|nr:FAD:protein FMN transferase [Myxococcales bacterium]
MLTIAFDTMGCAAQALLDGEGPAAEAALEALPARLARREHLLSRFDATSALCRLNEHGFADAVDDVLFDAVSIAVAAARETEGLVTPTIADALAAAGYDRDFAAVHRDQTATAPEARSVPEVAGIVLDPVARSIRLPKGVRLDLGGTAKGWCADEAVAWLSQLGPALVDLGGDIAVSPGRRPWPIAVEGPHGDDLDLVLLRSGGLATSGRDHRRWRRGGVEQHHLVDPRTGLCAKTDVLTVTVLGPSARAAETAAKRVLLSGTAEGLAFIEASGLSALVVRDDGAVLRSRRFAEHTWSPS